MAGALHPNWTPDVRILQETTDWITTPPNWWIRWSPLIAGLAVASLLAAAWLIKIPMSNAVPVSVIRTEEPDAAGILKLRSPVPARDIPLGEAVARITSGEQGRILRIAGEIVNVAPAPGGVVVTLACAIPPVSLESGLILVPNGRERLADMLLRRTTSRGSAQ